MISTVIEDNSDTSSSQIEETFLYQNIHKFFAGSRGIERVRNYPKASKIIRLMLILVLKGQSKRVGSNSLNES